MDSILSMLDMKAFFSIAFISIVIKLLVLDLFVLNRFLTNTRNTVLIALFYIIIALIFGAVLFFYDSKSGIEFFTGFLIEKTLSLDNVFVIKMIFDYFGIEEKKQRLVLFIGIVSAIVLRALMIFAGSVLLNEFHWVLNVFAVLLIISGIKIFIKIRKKDTQHHKSYVIDFLQNKIKVIKNSNQFFVKEKGSYRITTLFLSLVAIEIMDLVFAVDSVPAIFAVTQDTMIVYTSNIFAILGLRALYGIINDLDKHFYYIKHAMAFILCFVGVKIFIAQYITIPPLFSLSVTMLAIASGIIFSLGKNKQHEL